MADSTVIGVPAWRTALPMLSGPTVTLREPVADDIPFLVSVLSLGDATRFGLDDPISELSVQEFIERAARDRGNGVAAIWVITRTATKEIAGLIQVRQLDPMFEAAEWECTLLPSARGTGIFVEAARLAGSFAFGTLSTPPARSARAAAERPRQRRPAQARRRAGRRPPPLGALRR